jgi:hypothetical protein
MWVFSPGQNWWWTVLAIEISCNQWEGSACTQSALIFFLLSFGLGGEGFFFIFTLFPSSSQWVPICSPRAFSIAPRFNPICFAHSPPLLTCICGPKKEALYRPRVLIIALCFWLIYHHSTLLKGLGATPSARLFNPVFTWTMVRVDRATPIPIVAQKARTPSWYWVR